MMERKPYQSPQTTMERHIAELVEHLKDGKDSRSGFAAKVEHTMSHAFWLESECDRLRRENRQAQDDLAIGMIPSFTASWKGIEPELTSYNLERAWWEMEPQRWYCIMRPHQFKADEKAWRRIRNAAYKQLQRRIRTVFERTFPDRPLYSAQPKERVG